MLKAVVGSILALLLGAGAAGAGQATVTPENWREDLRSISNVLPQLHANFYFQVSRDAFQAAVAALDSEIPQLSDHQIIVRMAELVATVGDAHTSLNLSANPTGFRVYPIRVRWFDDGLFVIAALPGAEAAIGKKVAGINGMDIDAVYARIGRAISAENDPWRRRTSQDYVVIPEVLNAVGIIPNAAGAAAFQLQDSAETSFTLQLPPVAPGAARRWIYVPDPASEALPLHRKQSDQNYWFQYLSESRTFYFKYNVCANAANLSFSAFTAQFLAAVDAHPVERFIFDLRDNTGGNSGLINPLLAGLEQRFVSGALANLRLSVIVGRDTFSSGLLNALTLKAAPFTVLVGEPSGGKPNHYGQVSSLVLPRSGLRVSYSTRFFSSPVTTPSLNPDVSVPFPSAAFFAGRDPYLEAALEGSSASTDVSPFVVYSGGGSRLQSAGTAEAMRVGHGAVAPPSAPPFAFAILRYRRQGATVSEMTVTPSRPMRSGSIYAEVDGRVNTGLALANATDNTARVAFQIRRADGGAAGSGELTIPPRSQLSRFLSQPPFNVQSLAAGALAFDSDAPVSVLAVRGFSNERDEFLLSALPVADAAVNEASGGPLYCAHFAGGDGWTTEIQLVNPFGRNLSGAIELAPGERINYMLPPRSAQRFAPAGPGAGFVRITTENGSPGATCLFRSRRNSVTITEAAVQATPAAAAQQMIVAASGGFVVHAAGAVMSALAIANPAADAAAVRLTLTSLAGNVLGSATVQLDANSRRALFVDELFGGSVAMPFEATLSIDSSTPVAAAGLRAQYNERDDFLISATPMFGDAPGTVFPHVVDGGGYSMRFIFVARPGADGATLRFLDQSGAPLFLELRD